MLQTPQCERGLIENYIALTVKDSCILWHSSLCVPFSGGDKSRLKMQLHLTQLPSPLMLLPGPVILFKPLGGWWCHSRARTKEINCPCQIALHMLRISQGVHCTKVFLEKDVWSISCLILASRFFSERLLFHLKANQWRLYNWQTTKQTPCLHVTFSISSPSMQIVTSAEEVVLCHTPFFTTLPYS